MTFQKARKIAIVDGSLLLLTVILGIVAAFTALPFWVPCVTLVLSVAIDFLFLRKLTQLQKATVYSYEFDEEGEL
jgi:hypothetical protein